MQPVKPVPPHWPYCATEHDAPPPEPVGVEPPAEAVVFKVVPPAAVVLTGVGEAGAPVFGVSDAAYPVHEPPADLLLPPLKRVGPGSM